MKKITDLILDFDGTCTQIPLVYEAFLEAYRKGINAVLTPGQQISQQLWAEGMTEVRAHSPAAGWTTDFTPSAPAAADPYILSFETARYLFRSQSPQITTPIPLAAFVAAYAANPAPWRVETLEVIKELHKKGIAIYFVSNSSTQTITQRFQDLWGGTPRPDTIQVQGNAAKFEITEPDWDTLAGVPPKLTGLLDKVPAVQPDINIGRPLYLRRGNFFNVIAGIFSKNPDRFATSLFCGDVWELDLALPAAMGANIHLVERAKPFDTYDYEKALTHKAGGKVSPDLTGLLEWIK
ncbi:MAG TPA: hypothetical protein VL978_11110 [Puia sp.]|nr:hypothetical protein [Puia sp.]